MGIEFRRQFHHSVFLDPARDLAEKKAVTEVRYDPLTGNVSKLFPFRSLNFQRHDWEPFVEKSRQQFCPFCPGTLEKATPRFVKDFYAGGHIKAGEATVVPNLNPYEKYAAVVIMCREHYVPMAEIQPAMIIDSFQAALSYLKTARKYDPENTSYCSINWNYMPYAGGSIIHPHLQVLAGPHPGTYDAQMYAAANKFQDRTGNNFFDRFIEIEMEQKERYLGQTGKMHWLATFAPKHIGDVTGILPGKYTIGDLDDGDLKELAGGMIKVARYYDRINMPSFNAAVYFGLKGNEDFYIQLRMLGRFTIFPLVGSDITHMQVLHDDPWTVLLPEKLAADLRADF